MPLDNIKLYADLRDQGESTAEQRKELLQAHVAILEKSVLLHKWNY